MKLKLNDTRSLITRRPVTAYRRLNAPTKPAAKATAAPTKALAVTRSKESLLLEADREVVIRCGKASITLTADGKIIIKGANLLSTSSGQHRIRGASVSIN